MKNSEISDASKNLRFLPSVDVLLRTETAGRLLPETGVKHLSDLARRVTEQLRREIQENSLEVPEISRENLLDRAEKLLESFRRAEENTGLKKVVNATGVIVHTNLGRAPLSENARKAIFEQTSRYCNLEYDLATGRRGKRGERAEALLSEITGAESALIVNNCAAAAFLVLKVLASGGEAIVSRGELVEIGGDFRVPDVMTQSGVVLREVGTTNRTKISDYERAVNENTRLFLKVHPSNYRIVGFTESVEVAALAELARRSAVLLYEDAGSGAIFDLSEYGLTDEPVISRSIAAGADVVTFSGDKLLGGAQSGLIVGRREVIEKIRRHPLYRALRVDKLIYAALEATLESFLREKPFEEIPVLRMLAQTSEEIRARIENFSARLRERLPENADLSFEITKGGSVVGGGSAPMVQPATTLLAFKHQTKSVGRLEESLRSANPPVIARILEDKLLLDLRTVSENEEDELLEIMAKLN